MNRITYDDEGNPVVRPREIIPEHRWPGNLSAIFDIDGTSYDVLLEENKLSWTPLTGSGKGPKNKPKNKKKNKSDKDESEFSDNCIKVKNILGVRLRRLKRSGQKEGEGVCQGFSVYTYYKKSSIKWREWLLNLGHPSEETCGIWMSRIQSLLAVYDERPKKMRIFIQPYAGKRTGKSVFNEKVLPIFEAAGIEMESIDLKPPNKDNAEDEDDVNHNEHIKQEFVHIDLARYDSVVCVGGDGTVSKVMNGLLVKTQHENDVDIRPHFGPAKATVPLGIIPIGITNQIAHSVMGIEDPVTAAIHIILGHKHPVDVMSVYKDDKFRQFSFNGHYGYFGNVLPFLGRYALFGEKKLDAAFAKALTSSKFRSYECDISYLPSAVAGSSDPSDGHVCRQGCGVCSLDPNSADAGLVYEDKVMSLDPLNESGNSSVLEVTNEDNPWKTVKGTFSSVSLLSISGLSELSPLGIGPYTHLADGTLDLILVHSTERKEFVRYLKRHANDKNQLSFPFVESHRCREVRFHVRSQQTWNFKDLSKNEIVEAAKIQEIEATQKAKKNQDEVLVIDQLDSSSEEDAETLHSSSIASGVNSITSSAKKKTEKKPPQTKNLNWMADSSKGLTKRSAAKGYTNQVLDIQDESEDDLFRDEKEEEENESEADSKSGDDESEKLKKNKKDKKKEKEKKKKEKEKEKKKKEEKKSKDEKKDRIKKHVPLSEEEFEDSDEDDSRAGSAEGRLQEGTNTLMFVSDNYKVSMVEKERMRRAKSKQKKSEKKQRKAESKGRALWNIDNEIEIEQDLLFRIHQGLVLIHGLGVPKDYDPDDAKFGCLGIF